MTVCRSARAYRLRKSLISLAVERKLMKHILIVDDDESLRFVLSELLKRDGYECSLASSVEEARLILREKKYDLIISDFNMPRESGMDLLRHVSCLHSDTPFIMMSANDNLSTKREALQLGAYAYIVKPFRLKDLLALPLFSTLGGVKSTSHERRRIQQLSPYYL